LKQYKSAFSIILISIPCFAGGRAVGRLQVDDVPVSSRPVMTFIPRTAVVKKDDASVAAGQPKSNADFRSMFLKKKE
jgi:hypothetical protein